MLGFINVYKPSGITSNAVVQKIRKKFKIKKVGHMGTLDPMACGILPIAVGKATRLFDYALDKTKRYIATFDFGFTTDSLDTTGVITNSGGRIPSKDEIESKLDDLCGDIDQVPPNFSAKNINGMRAYELARRGVDFELKPKTVSIYHIKLIEQISENRFKFDIMCSSGTYIRSISRDMAEILNTFGCMSALERIQTGCFNVDNSINLDDLLDKNSLKECLISPIEVFSTFDICEIDKKTCLDLINGKYIPYKELDKNTFICCEGRIVGIAKVKSSKLILDTYLYEEGDE